MKRIFSVFVAIILFCGCTSNENISQNNSGDTLSVKESLVSSFSQADESDANSEELDINNAFFRVPMDLGIPLESKYAEYPLALTPRDMIVYDGFLYISSGDWTGNKGPVEMYRYDIENSKWENSGTLLDEEINSFHLIEDTVYIPGVDPMESWDWGNLYLLQNGGWQTRRTIPNGIHCFDLAYQNDVLFAAVKTSADYHQVAVSHDMGKTFVYAPLIKNGETISNPEFYYDLFVIGNDVFAFCDYELYRYDGSQFLHVTSWKETIKTKYYNTPSSGIFSGEVNDDTRLYFSTGYFYICDEVKNVRQIDTPNKEIVYDMCLHDEKMYLLCNLKIDAGYEVTVYRFDIADEQFLIEAKVISDIPAISFAITDDKIYFGTASNNFKKQNHGRIFEIERTI